jgi:hypothetical protein
MLLLHKWLKLAKLYELSNMHLYLFLGRFSLFNWSTLFYLIKENDIALFKK